jgi:hypothetical protein
MKSDGLQTDRERAKKLARLDRDNQLPKLVLGVTFNEWIEVIQADRPSAHNRRRLTGRWAALNL